jgi:DNA-nicking Smr family endonuclease
MDFGEILNEWERIKHERGDDLEWYRSRDLADRDEQACPERRREEEARRLARLPPQAELDLHGMKASEAETAIEIGRASCRERVY